MKTALVVAALLHLMVLSRQRLAVWHDERTLWSSAWETQPTARAAVHLGALAAIGHRDDEVALWTQQAISLASGPDAARTQVAVQAQLRFSALNGSALCARPPWASWC